MDNLVLSFTFLINMVFQFFVSFVFWVCGMLDCCRITSRLLQDYHHQKLMQMCYDKNFILNLNLKLFQSQ